MKSKTKKRKPTTSEVGSLITHPSSVAILTADHASRITHHGPPSIQESINPSGRYALRRGLGFWDLTFDGHHATLKHEQGLAYVACLLLNPPEKPIHALDLATRLAARNGKHFGITEIVDPKSGQKAYLESHARIQERSPALDDAIAMQSVLRQQNRLEDLLEQGPVEPIKEELERELIVLYNYETRHSGPYPRQRPKGRACCSHGHQTFSSKALKCP